MSRFGKMWHMMNLKTNVVKNKEMWRNISHRQEHIRMRMEGELEEVK